MFTRPSLQWFLLKTMQRYKLFSNPPNLPSGRHGNYIKIAKELIVVGRRRRALKGRYPFIAQGASPGLIIETYLLSPKGAALPRRKANARVVVPLLRSSYFCVHVYPGFHIGLCPHSTLGFEEVSCLKALAISLNFDEVTLSCDGGLHIPPLSTTY